MCGAAPRFEGAGRRRSRDRFASFCLIPSPFYSSPPPLRGRLGWGVIIELDVAVAFFRAIAAYIATLQETPHPNLPLKGGGDKVRERGATLLSVIAGLHPRLTVTQAPVIA